jgi:hypothetical protein
VNALPNNYSARGLAKSAVLAVRGNAAEIKESAESAPKMNTKRISYSRLPTMELIKKDAECLFQDQNDANLHTALTLRRLTTYIYVVPHR